MDAGNIGAIVIALIAAIGAWLSNRAAGRAAVANTMTSGRLAMETEAYDRARALDTETIRRQDAELEDLRSKHAVCSREIAEIREQHVKDRQEMQRAHAEEINLLRQRIARLEQGLHQNLEELLHARLHESSDTTTE